MKLVFLAILLLACGLTGVSQPGPAVPTNQMEQMDSIVEAWLEDLYDFGVERTPDSVVLNKEVEKIFADSVYRKLIYPDFYLMPVAHAMIEKKALKPALWYLINIYAANEKNKDAVLRTIMPYDQIIELDRALVAAYYTYIGFDPEVYTKAAGSLQPREVSRPDIVEKKLTATKEIVEHVLFYRSQRTGE